MLPALTVPGPGQGKEEKWGQPWKSQVLAKSTHFTVQVHCSTRSSRTSALREEKDTEYLPVDNHKVLLGILHPIPSSSLCHQPLQG